MRRPHADHWFERANTEKGGIQATFRTALRIPGNQGSREIFSTVSPRYHVFDGPDAVDAFLGAIPADGRADVLVEGARWKFKSTFHTPLLPSEVVVGDVLRAWVSIAGRDDGRGGFRVSVGIDEARCLNCTEIHAVNVEGVRHAAEAAKKFVALVKKQFNKIEGFATKWAEAQKDNIIAGLTDGGADPHYVFGQLVDRGLVSKGGVGREEMVERLVRHSHGHHASRYDVVRAITEAAHVESWKSPWFTEELEAEAGQLLYNYVYVAPEAQEQTRGGLLEIN